MMHAFDPSALEAETGDLSLRTAWSTTVSSKPQKIEGGGRHRHRERQRGREAGRQAAKEVL